MDPQQSTDAPPDDMDHYMQAVSRLRRESNELTTRLADAEARIARMQKAGDALAHDLRGALGIDPMRSLLLRDWREASRG
jgi:hypothetical protein